MITLLTLNTIRTELGICTDVGRQALDLALENVVLMDKKQQDYGPHNIGETGIVGVIVRMNDKMARIKHLRLKQHISVPRNESLEDSYRDIANYAFIAIMLERGTWPEE